MSRMVSLFEKLQSSIIATCEVPRSQISSYGVIKGVPVEGFGGRVYRVQDVVEKPAADKGAVNMAIIRRYILNAGDFQYPRKYGTWRLVERFS
jgi:UTP--glucose-1-phosphate uridylyltransferase